MMEEVTKKLPNVKAVATTLREVHATNRHSWSAVLWLDGKTYQAKAIEIAKFEIKALQTVFSEAEIDSVCDVSQSMTEERIITMRD